jgi:hypothetical protein
MRSSRLNEVSYQNQLARQAPLFAPEPSGRGRAPAWLAGAKDRAKFLIVGASAAADAKPAVTKAVAKRTPTAKKTAAKKVVSAKVPAKKAPRKSVAVPAPLATVEAGAELTT